VYFLLVVKNCFAFKGAKRDKDGYYWITGRVDDMLNVSGHLLSTAQVESALIEHKGNIVEQDFKFICLWYLF
jgi:acetyl-CoA synthetase